MTKTKITTAITTVALLSACASGPDAIAPVAMDRAFDNVSCGDAQRLLRAERPKLASLEAQQRDAAAADAIGVFFFLVPLGSAFGNDVEGDLATSKGKVIALENRLLSC